jgi:hypothetical protein
MLADRPVPVPDHVARGLSSGRTDTALQNSTPLPSRLQNPRSRSGSRQCAMPWPSTLSRNLRYRRHGPSLVGCSRIPFFASSTRERISAPSCSFIDWVASAPAASSEMLKWRWTFRSAARRPASNRFFIFAFTPRPAATPSSTARTISSPTLREFARDRMMSGHSSIAGSPMIPSCGSSRTNFSAYFFSFSLSSGLVIESPFCALGYLHDVDLHALARARRPPAHSLGAVFPAERPVSTEIIRELERRWQRLSHHILWEPAEFADLALRLPGRNDDVASMCELALNRLFDAAGPGVNDALQRVRCWRCKGVWWFAPRC